MIKVILIVGLIALELSCGSGPDPCDPRLEPLGYNGVFSGRLGQTPILLTLAFTQLNRDLEASGTYGELPVRATGAITSNWNAQITLIGANNGLYVTETLSNANLVSYETCQFGPGEQVERFTIAPTSDPSSWYSGTLNRQGD